jgi:cytochrome c oxidase cbb3-type subunit III
MTRTAFRSRLARPGACVAGALLLAAAAVPGCRREERRFEDLAATSRRPGTDAAPRLRPGAAPDPAPDAAGPADTPRAASGDNAYDVSQGRRLYDWFNCAGCHAHGGGAIGPPLMDETWRYGSEPRNVYDSILHGRPNGMPAFGGKIPEAQLWQLVAYVRAMSGLVPIDARAARADEMSNKPPESLRAAEPPRAGGAP